MSDPSQEVHPPRRPKRRRLSRQQEQRRRLLRSFAVGLGLALLYPLTSLPVVRRWRSRLRPPGALAGEQRFLGACIKCGQCVQVCPVEAIALADAKDGLGVGAPYIDARAQACDFSCDALSCILACPTGALDHVIKAKEEVQIGYARLARPEGCLARQGKPFRGQARGAFFEGKLRYEEVDRWNPLPVREHAYDREVCDLCVLECPIGREALRLVPLGDGDGGARWTPEVHRGCVGCGVCEMVCPAEPAAIVVDEGATPPPRGRGQGRGRHAPHDPEVATP